MPAPPLQRVSTEPSRRGEPVIARWRTAHMREVSLASGLANSVAMGCFTTPIVVASSATIFVMREPEA